MKRDIPKRIKTISEFHRLKGLPKPLHPLISVIEFKDILQMADDKGMVLDFYSIALKKDLKGKFIYGQQEYDFDEGILFFVSPGQVFRVDLKKGMKPPHLGWMLLVHPDFLWKTPLAKSIKEYEYFDYAVNEALFLSDKEENTIINIFQNIHQEYQSNIDKFSQDLIIAQLELFFKFADRFYHRQFITRKKVNHQILSKVEALLNDYFDKEDVSKKGLPTPQYIADGLNISRNYLSSLLKVLTGQNTQHHIHEKLIEKAKEKLSTTNLSVSEISYALGFEHPQSFSRLFKIKTTQSPLEFRQSFH